MIEFFPGAGFESSILTIILLGVLVRWACTEWFGFTFAGLVVPGYLASVLIIAPYSGGVILVESVLTYLIVWVLVDYFGDTMVWSASFGRDRFFAFVLVSLFVRLTGELWLWPQLWEVAAQSFELSKRPPANLNSLGLVLVPLTANMFWKTGLWRGGVQVIAPTALVWWVSSYLLLPWTNLRFSKFQVHYEAAAIDILAAPKTYAIMLVGAAIAARANIRYGWDFGGILIPALVAISFFEPGKVVISVAEAWALAMVVQGLLRTPLLRGLNLEGPRRIVLVFGVAYLLKYVFAWVVYLNFPHVQVTDFFSFGYLLSSLLALKIMQRGTSRVLTPTLLVSAAAFIIGGLGADLLFESLRPRTPAITRQVDDGLSDAIEPDATQTLLVHAPLLTHHAPTRFVPLSVERLDGIARYISKLSRVDLDRVERGEKLVFEVSELGLVHTRLREPDGMTSHLIAEPATLYPAQVGVGMLWLRPGATGPAIEVPEGADDPLVMLAVVELARHVQARHVVFGARSRLPYGAEVEPFGAIPSLFDHVHQELARRGDILRILPTKKPYSTLWAGARMSAQSALPGTLDRLGDVRVEWRYPESFIVQDVEGESALLELSSSGARAVTASSSVPTSREGRMVKSLQQGLFAQLYGSTFAAIARQPRQLDMAPTAAELEVVQRGVIAPLLRLGDGIEPIPAALPAYLRRTVDVSGLYLEDIELPNGTRYWLLRERPGVLRGWGMVLIRQNRGEEILLETPRPLKEESVWRVSAMLAQDLEARVISFGSPSRRTQGPLTGEPATTPSLLVATQRAWLDMRGDQPVVLQVRGLSEQKDASRFGLVLSHEKAFRFRHEQGVIHDMYEQLQDIQIPAVVDVGQAEFATLHGLPDLSAQLAAHLGQGRFVRLWVSARARRALTPSPSLVTWRRMLQRLHTSHLSPSPSLDAWRTQPHRSHQDVLPALEPSDLLEIQTQIQDCVATRNPLELEALMASLEQRQIALQWLLDEPHEQVWAVGYAEIAGRRAGVAFRTSSAPLDQVAFVDGRSVLESHRGLMAVLWWELDMPEVTP